MRRLTLLSCGVALASNVACMSYRPPPPGVSIADRTVRVSSAAGVTITAAHPDGSGRMLSCGARFVDGRIASFAGDTVVLAVISQRSSDPGSAFACRDLRAGAVTPRRDAALQITVPQADAGKTAALLVLIVLVVGLILAEDWEYDQPFLEPSLQ